MALSPSHSQSLLPNPGILILDRIKRESDRFRLIVHIEQYPKCPVCACISNSVHSSYCRCLQDLPWQEVSVQICATVSRFRCRNRSCPRRIFCERLTEVAKYTGDRLPERRKSSESSVMSLAVFPVSDFSLDCRYPQATTPCCAG